MIINRTFSDGHCINQDNFPILANLNKDVILETTNKSRAMSLCKTQ